MNPDQTADQSYMDLHCLPKRLKIFQQTTKAYDFFVICALRLTNMSSLFIRSGFS